MPAVAAQLVNGGLLTPSAANFLAVAPALETWKDAIVCSTARVTPSTLETALCGLK